MTLRLPPWRTKNTVSAVLFSVAVLFFANTVRSGVIVDKSFLPRFLLLAAILLVTFLALFRKKGIFRFTLFECAFILFYTWNILSCLWAISSSEALAHGQMVFLSLAVFLVISAFARGNPAFEATFIKIQILVLFFAFGLALYKMGNLEFFDPYRVISVSANNNLFSGFLLISMALVLGGYALLHGVWKYLAFTAGIGSLFFIIITQSRAAYLGLGAALAITSILAVFRYRRIFSTRNLLKGTAALIVLATCVFIFYSRLDETRKQYFLGKIRVWDYFMSPREIQEEQVRRKSGVESGLDNIPAFDFSADYYENANLRYIFWKKSMPLIAEHPLLGVGTGNWRLAVGASPYPVNPEHTRKNFTYSYPHNEWIGAASELGVPGLFLFLLVCLIPLVLAFNSILFSPRNVPPEAMFYTSFIAGFYLFASFDFPMKRVEHCVLLFSVIAFLLLKVPRGTKEIFAVSSPLRRVCSIIFTLLLLLTLVGGSARIRGEYYTVKVFRNERKNDLEVIRLSRKAESVFYRITPNTLPLAWFEGVAQYRRGKADSALLCFERALKSTPYEVRVLNDYAISRYGLGQIPEARAILLHTIALDPFFEDARFNIAALYYFSGRPDSARFYLVGCRPSEKKDEFLKELDLPR